MAANAKSSHMKDAVAAYRAGSHLNREEAAVLDRLVADSRAASAFAKFNADGRTAAKILRACIEADTLFRTFSARSEIEDRMLGENHKGGRLDKLAKAVADLRSFINELDCEPADRLSAFVRYDPADADSMTHGLYLLDNAIAARRRIAQESRLRMGTTRKIRGEAAARIAAIGWLAEGVRRSCGRPHQISAAALAEATLGGEVTVDQLREAERTRRQRDWRC
jgi:hypothetical protein